MCIRDRKKTKIVATISDKRCEVEFLEKLYRAGMNVVRLNTAHQDMEQALKVVENVRKVSDNIAILIDTKGPEVRTMLMDEPMHVDRGETIYPVSYTHLDFRKITINQLGGSLFE